MNNHTTEGQWKQIKGNIKAKWGELTDDDVKQAEGNQDHLIGKLQEKYGMTKDKAMAELKALTGG